MATLKNLNVIYYMTSGPGPGYNKMYGGIPFYLNYRLEENENKFNLNLIKNILKRDKINTSKIDDYRYLNTKKNCYIKIKEHSSYPIESNEIILQLHFKETKNSHLIEIGNRINEMKNSIKELEEEKMNSMKINKNIDLYFLYASPLIINSKNGNKEQELFIPINYRREITIIYNLFKKSGKKLNCIFECANKKELINAIIKQPKILHISSHGIFNEKREYSLYLEEKGVLENISQNELKDILSRFSEQLKNIDLVFISSCYSETLGKMFSEYGTKNVIYIQEFTPISQKAAINFTEYFYSELIKGSNIKDSFSKSQKLVKHDISKNYFQIEKCCCKHWHKPKNFCKLKRNEKYIHTEYHIKCDCDFEEFNTHKENCKLIEKIKNNNDENLFYFEYKNDIIKICCSCCKPDNDNNIKEMLPHEESLKFILKDPNDDNILFQSKEFGKLNINKNCFIMNDDNKRNSVVGRRKQIKEIYNILDGGDENMNNIRFIIIHGKENIGKQTFAELACIYLFERKVINWFYKIEIKESKKELWNKIEELPKSGENPNDKYIVIIKINYKIEKPLDLLNEILIDYILPNFYYIILLSTPNDKIDHHLINCANKYKIIYLAGLDKDSSLQLLCDLCRNNGYAYINNFKKLTDNQIKDLVELTKYSFHKINELLELIGSSSNYEEIKEKLIHSKNFNEKDNIQKLLSKLKEKDISKIYFYLSIMTYGLPPSMLKLFEPDYNKIINKKDEEHLINKEDWFTIRRYKKQICEFIIEIEKREYKEYICKCLEIYAKLL